jgi:DNA-directed RNA polymerase specialized sigma subunit
VCNFTPDEEKLFELRLRDVSLEDCAEIMTMSTASISRLHKRVLEKIREES